MGTVLLLAAAPASEARLLDAASALPGLAAVPAGVFTGTESASVIELADPVDPQAVLVRFRAAAAAEGPLTMVIVGELHADPKRGGIHLALARTNPSTIRYSALPWAWLTHELAARAPGTTTLLVDLAAGPAAWELLGREGLPMGEGVAMYGRVFPAGAPSRWRRKSGGPAAAPAYIQEFVRVWRSGARPPLAQLHEQAAALAGPRTPCSWRPGRWAPGRAVSQAAGRWRLSPWTLLWVRYRHPGRDRGSCRARHRRRRPSRSPCKSRPRARRPPLRARAACTAISRLRGRGRTAARRRGRTTATTTARKRARPPIPTKRSFRLPGRAVMVRRPR